MKSFITAVVFLSLFASQASALSCMRPDVARSFNWANKAEEAYVVLYGDFSYPTPPSSDTGDINAPRVVEVAALFNGQALTLDGFQPTDPLNLTIRLDCAGPWCGGLPEQGGEMLAFVERTADGYLLTVDPCGGALFQRVSDDELRTVEACLRSEGCVEGDLN